MFTIKQAARLSGVNEATLRTWERRYGVVSPTRTDSGYRLYDPSAIGVLGTMRRLIEAGWTASTAARAIKAGEAPPFAVLHETEGAPTKASAALVEEFLSAAARFDVQRVSASLDKGMSVGSFEHAVDTWLSPALVALGEAWARGDVDPAGEHMASHQVLRRLAAAFEAAGTRSRGPRVVVGLPAGSRHELGALAFATAIRRLGHDVLYLGPDVPEQSWLNAVHSHDAAAAVLGVTTAADQPSARRTTTALAADRPDLLIACGGAHASALDHPARALPPTITEAAHALDALLHEEAA